ncbi:hypothetical protein C9374_005222 [Naegleria lovaniensis]|uniref:Histidine kinase n=1 Tax=Naegleria lovaniensis TaxID=51637 RepID=A0AA88GQU2_NAELO|nr:uncharacterized protein C9374_005222 [Naegleria lovaniensis]KAG2382642.1 hypothetical protein C9374_005222 [Naegleria lovaniensis]
MKSQKALSASPTTSTSCCEGGDEPNHHVTIKEYDDQQRHQHTHDDLSIDSNNTTVTPSPTTTVHPQHHHDHTLPSSNSSKVSNTKKKKEGKTKATSPLSTTTAPLHTTIQEDSTPCIDKEFLNHVLKKRRNDNSSLFLALSVVPQLLALTFSTERGSSTFLIISILELAFQAFLDSLNISTLKGLIYSNVVRVALMVVTMFTVQIYYGPHFPYHLVSTFKILLLSRHIFFRLSLMAMCGGLVLVCSCVSLFCAYLLERNEMTEAERTDFYYRMFEVFVLQYGVLVGAYIFSNALISSNLEYTRQQVDATQARVKNSEKTKFIANLSHEARNPLHCIMGSLQILNHHFEGETCCGGCKHCFVNHSAIGEIIEDIKENASLLLHILSSSLQMSSLEMGKIQLKSEVFNLKFLQDSLVGVFAQLAHEKNISLHSFFNVAQVPQFFKGDSVRLSQVIMNIISNAVKYTKQGYVRVNCNLATIEDLKDYNSKLDNQLNVKEMLSNSVSSPFTFVKLEVIDTGCGIAPQEIDNLFQPYRIVEQKNDENISLGFEQYLKQSENMKLNDGGSSLINTSRNGLGLSITKLLIDKMNGKIHVNSVLNEGTTVTVILPLQNTTNDMSDAISEILQGDDIKFCVKIIDPDECFRNVLKDYLELFKNLVTLETFESLEEMSPISSNPSLKTMIFCTEEHYKVLKDIPNNYDNVVLVPTTFRGAEREFFDIKYLAKPVRFSELVEFMSFANATPRDETVPVKDQSTPSHNHAEPNSCNNHSEDSSLVETNNAAIDLSKFSVILADDNAVNRKVLVKMLQIIGFKDIDTSNDGMECFEKFKQKSYHLVLLDCFMPILSGRETCEMIRNLEKQTHTRVPIIAVTANTFESEQVLKSNGFDHVIYKPFEVNYLKQVFTNFLDYYSRHHFHHPSNNNHYLYGNGHPQPHHQNH